ncbi:zinc ribbon domain-containing protein [Candidatus Mesenet endosymbiont of Agriotes lineatus]|uniref:zinc ribbon domain-containing protein n=1 Tax=Candidatus Mesenet endosymbiont of Agriotes lineatus TaxID=3077948 RepID=UPI0030D313E8
MAILLIKETGQHQAIINEELWNKAQEVFVKRKDIKPKEEYRALLKGLISCDSCKSVMKATYTKKKNKRYCYYVCNSYIRGKGCLLSSSSIAAGEIERAVVMQIRLLLKNPIREANLQILDDKKISQLQRIDRSWDNFFPREQEKIIRKLVKAIRVSEDGARICINPTELIRLAGNIEEGSNDGMANEEIFLFTSLKFNKSSNQTVILSPEFKEEKSINYTLLKALVRAHMWQRQLTCGKYGTIKELYSQERPGSKYPQRVLKLNFLSPKIKEDILNGSTNLFPNLSGIRNMPILWHEQEKIFYEQ